MAEMLESMAVGIAEAQHELDLMSTRVAEMMSSGEYSVGAGRSVDKRMDFHGERLSLMELGLSPSFYQLVEAILEIKVSVTINRERITSREKTDTKKVVKVKRHGFFGLGGSTTTTRTTSVSARYSNRFQYSAEGASQIQTRMVPIPPPNILQERMRELAQASEKGSI